LIMTFLDHTARPRHLVWIKPKSESTSTVDRPRQPWDAERERRQTYASQRTGTVLAVAVIVGFPTSHRPFNDASKTGKRLGLLPLNLVQPRPGDAADLSHHHVDAPTPEAGG
jgi:hypothetical protein